MAERLPEGLFGGRRLAWQCFLGGYVSGLDRLLPIDAVACMDDGADFDLMRERDGPKVFAVEAGSGRRRNWIGAPIDTVFATRGPELAAWLERAPREAWLVTSQPTCAALAEFCREQGYAYVGTAPEAAARLSHKVRLFEALEVLQLPRAPGRWLGRARPSWSDLSADVGSDLVVQRPEGYAGVGTARVRSAQEWAAVLARLGDGELWVAPHLGGLTLNINVEVHGGRGFAGFPSVQLSGVPELGAGWGGYCGNDYTAATALDPALVEDVQEQSARLGAWMGAQGFAGACGFDFVIDAGSGCAVAVDLNPRWQGSTSLAVQAELADGRLPLAAAGFAVQAGVLGPAELASRADGFRRPLCGAQMNLRAVLAAPRPVVGGARPGTRGGAAGVRPALRLDELDDDEHLVTAGVPRAGSQVEPGAWIGRLVSRRSVLAADGVTLAPWARRAVDDYRAELGLPAPADPQAGGPAPDGTPPG